MQVIALAIWFKLQALITAAQVLASAIWLIMHALITALPVTASAIWPLLQTLILQCKCAVPCNLAMAFWIPPAVVLITSTVSWLNFHSV